MEKPMVECAGSILYVSNANAVAPTSIALAATAMMRVSLMVSPYLLVVWLPTLLLLVMLRSPPELQSGTILRPNQTQNLGRLRGRQRERLLVVNAC